MQLTPTEATCPLCKDPISAGGGHPDPTRLCEDCRQMVQTIRSTASTSVAVTETSQARSMPQPPAAIPAPTKVLLTDEAGSMPHPPVAIPVQSEVLVTDEPRSMPHPPVTIPAQNEVPITDEAVITASSGSPESATTVGEPDLFALGITAGIDRDPFDFDELFDDVSFGNSHLPELPHHTSEPSDEGALQISPAIVEPMSEAASHRKCAASLPAELAEAPSDLAAVIASAPISPAELNETDPAFDSRIGGTTDGPPVPPFLRHEVVTDPLEAPAQTPDSSSEDYPLLVPNDGLSTVSWLKLPVAAALVACCSIAGYFLMQRPSIEVSRTKRSVPEQASAPVTGLQAVSQPLLPALASPSEAKESQGLQTENENSGGRYSLQAAAFPNEAAANEFCERLKRASVPAYVVSAEIAGRGKWFRVRVGRFESAQDADRFAFESRRRARAAGLSLQLIVIGYDKP